MQPFDEIRKYSNVVCEQIRWEKAHNIVAVEIENHILDQRDAFLSTGEDEITATQKAIKEMGDAVSVGLALDKTHKPKPQWAMIAFGLFILCYFGDFTLLGKRPSLIYCIFTIIFLLGLLLGVQVNGASRWMIGTSSISLSYLSLLCPLVYALLVYDMRNKGYKGILVCGAGYLPLAAILIVIPTYSGLLLFTISALSILCLTIAKGWFDVNKRKGFAIVFTPLLFVVIALSFLFSNNLLERINRVINPSSDRYGSGYIYCFIRDVLGYSKLMSKGNPIIFEGNSIPLAGSLDTDYMLTILTYHFGWIAFISIMAIIIVFSILGFRYIFKQKNMLGTLVAFSILTTFVVQVLFYTLSNLGYGFFGVLSLPFISYGRTSLFINAILVGFMLSVFRTGDVYRDGERTYPAKFMPL